MIYCNYKVFNEIFVPLEQMILTIEKDEDFLSIDNFLKHIIEQGKKMVPEILPKCHDIQSKLVAKFLTQRYKFAVSQAAKRRKLAAQQKQKGSQKGSKSMYKKAAADDIK